jgi:hypothetical protein
VNLRTTFLVRFSLTGIVFLLGWCLPAQAQRVTSLSGSVDVGGGLDIYPTNTVNGESSVSDSFYNLSPSATISSRTARSTLSLGYAFGYNHFGNDTPRNSTSHAISLSWNRQLSTRWNMSVSDYYSLTNDLQTFYALRGLAIEDDALVLYFYPVTTNTSIGTNHISLGVNRTLSPRSQLSFSVNHSMGLYGETEEVPLVGLSDQQTISASVSYSRQLTDRMSWNVAYNGSYFSFDNFNSAISTAVIAGLTSTVAKDTTLSINAGPQRVNNLKTPGNNTSVTASISVSKRFKENNFHASIGHDNASSSGVGSVSTTRRASAGVSRSFGHRVNVFGDFSLFDGTGIVGNPFQTRGTSATANMGFTLARNLSLQGGVQFQRYTKPSPYAYTQKRLFVSLRYSHPNLLRSR